MGAISFSILRFCKHKPLFYQLRTLASDSVIETCIKPEKESVSQLKTLKELELTPLEVASSWPENVDHELRCKAIEGMRVIPNFVSEQEEQSLMIEVEPVLKRMRYEFDHWDGAIEGFRETEHGSWTELNEHVIARMKSEACVPMGTKWLKHIHVLDLAPAGHIRPHVDAVRFCGETIVGLCLLSSAVMRLTHTKNPSYVINALLPQRGLYIMRGVSRYEFEHEVLSMKDSYFCNVAVPRKRRVALIARTEPLKEHTL